MENSKSLTHNEQKDMALTAFIGETASPLASQIGDQLRTNGLQIHVFSDLAELIATMEKTLPDVVLLNPKLVKNGVAAKALYPKTPTIIYSTQLDTDEQQNFYQDGVKRVIIEPEDLAERAAAAANMVLRRRHQMRLDRMQSLTHGTVQAFSLAEVMQNALLEKKNLILKVKHKDWQAKLRMFQGHSVNGFTSNLSNEDALLKTLQLTSGSFVIRSYQKMEEFSPMSASTLAILAEARFEKKQIKTFLEKYCGGTTNPELSINSQKTGDIPDSLSAHVMSIMEKYSLFQDILLHSPYAILKTLKVLGSLYSGGFISKEGDGDGITTEGFNAEDATFLRENLFVKNSTVGNLVVLGLPESGRSELVKTYAGTQASSVKSVQAMDFAKININRELQLTIVGVSIEETFLPILDKISQGLIGCIFLIDAANPSQFEFINYLASRIMQLYDTSFVIGLTNVGDDPEAALAAYHKRFNTPPGIQVLPVIVDSFSDAKNLLFQLKNIRAKTDEDS